MLLYLQIMFYFRLSHLRRLQQGLPSTLSLHALSRIYLVLRQVYFSALPFS
jgi:hypothetical protein